MAVKAQSRVLVGHCGVDSGQILLTDPCYVSSFKHDEQYEPTAPNSKNEYPFSYNGACGATLSKAQAGQLAGSMGVAVTSGWGDGVYPVYADFNEHGRISSVTIVFDDEDDDEFDSDEFDSDEEEYL